VNRVKNFCYYTTVGLRQILVCECQHGGTFLLNISSIGNSAEVEHTASDFKEVAFFPLGCAQ
jgi:hypothetical protein